MAAIHTIKIKNFKAFPDEETIVLNGRNLLMYGENGSGKSSVYFALYTFLQSSIQGKETAKYFNRANKENLLNIHSGFDQSFIKISLTDKPSKFYELSLDGLQPVGDIFDIGNLNLASDFISHRLLINFYNFRNSNQINLFNVFYHDILPYWQTADKEYYLSDLLNKVKNEMPYGTATVLNGHGELVEEFNKELEILINKINLEATSFYNSYFKNEEDPPLQIKLYYQSDNDPEREEGDNNLYWMRFERLEVERLQNNRKKKFDTQFYDLTEPFIRLAIKEKKEDEYLLIDRPQTYLNEARLTAIALSIRFSLLVGNNRPNIEGRILALDDLLISLDMNNRDKVIQIILNEFLAKYPYTLYIFTHDKSFFNLCKKRIEQTEASANWSFKVIINDNRESPRKPFIDISFTSIQKAHTHFINNDYPACANYLRQHLESYLKDFLPENKLFTNINNQITPKNLSELLASFKELFDIYKNEVSVINDLFVYKDRLLNPLSHDNLHTPVYREELAKVFDALTYLQYFNSKLLKEVTKPENNLVYFVDTNSTGFRFIYTIELYENLYKYFLDDSTWHLSHAYCKVLHVSRNGFKDILCNTYKPLSKCIKRLGSFLNKTYSSDEEILEHLYF